jgi:hypothetical protein
MMQLKIPLKKSGDGRRIWSGERANDGPLR